MNYTTVKVLLSCPFHYKNTSHFTSYLSASHLKKLSASSIHDSFCLCSDMDIGVICKHFVEVQVEVNLRPVGQSVLVSGAHLGPVTNFSFSLKFPLDSCCFIILYPLWREDGSVIYLYNCFWALPEQSLLGWSPTELTAVFYCLIWDSHNLEGQVPVFISPRNRVAQLYRRALGSIFDDSCDSQGLRCSALNEMGFAFSFLTRLAGC
jgi:hypothetical protein